MRDRRNGYGERGANSRFAIARHKAEDIRAVRRRENTPLKSAARAGSEDELVNVQLRVVNHPPRSWKKNPDRELGEMINRKQVRRAGVAAAGGRRKARG